MSETGFEPAPLICQSDIEPMSDFISQGENRERSTPGVGTVPAS